MSAPLETKPVDEKIVNLESPIPNPTPKESSWNGRKIAVLAFSGIATGIALVALVIAAVFAWYVVLPVCAAVVLFTSVATGIAASDLKNKKIKPANNDVKKDDQAIQKLQEEHRLADIAKDQIISELEGLLETANKKVVELETELNEIDEEDEGVTEASDSKVKELQAEVKKYKDIIERAKNEYLLLQNTYGTSQNNIITLKASEEKLKGQIITLQQKLISDQDTAKKDINRITKQLKIKIAEVEKLKQSVDSSSTSSTSPSNSEAEQRISKLEDEITELKESKIALETKIKELNDHYSSEINIKNQEIAQLKKELAEFQTLKGLDELVTSLDSTPVDQKKSLLEQLKENDEQLVQAFAEYFPNETLASNEAEAQ